MNRCYTKTNKDYPAVGGAGIKVCDRWHNYDNFKADMGDKPEDSIMTRYCNGVDFTPENTYWMPKIHTRRNDLYGIWKSIKRRCNVDRDKRGVYGKLGVTMFPDWEISFDRFCEGVGSRPSKLHSLDRIDNQKGYWPGNVRWATKKEQSNNRMDNVYIEMDGERKTLQQWCEHYGVPRVTVTSRWRTLFSKPAARRNQACQQLSIGDVLINEYAGVAEAAAQSGVGRAAIQSCLSGVNSTAGGYKWRYVTD